MNYRASVSEPTIFTVLHMLKNPQISLRVRRDDHVGNWKREEDAHEFAVPRGPYRTPEPCFRSYNALKSKLLYFKPVHYALRRVVKLNSSNAPTPFSKVISL